MNNQSKHTEVKAKEIEDSLIESLHKALDKQMEELEFGWLDNEMSQEPQGLLNSEQ